MKKFFLTMMLFSLLCFSACAETPEDELVGTRVTSDPEITGLSNAAHYEFYKKYADRQRAALAAQGDSCSKSAVSAGFFDDDGNFFADGELAAGISAESLAELRKECRELFEQQVLPYYVKKYPETEFYIGDGSMLAFEGEDTLLTGIELRAKGPGIWPIMDRFAVDSSSRDIFVYNAAADSYTLWNGSALCMHSLSEK
ncbi:MAG: hypothetical protein ACI4LA_01785 [Emergencia sp.]